MQIMRMICECFYVKTEDCQGFLPQVNCSQVRILFGNFLTIPQYLAVHDSFHFNFRKWNSRKHIVATEGYIFMRRNRTNNNYWTNLSCTFKAI